MNVDVVEIMGLDPHRDRLHRDRLRVVQFWAGDGSSDIVQIPLEGDRSGQH